jgi:nicotinamide mononucleotide (NMN) deamidase PncC
MAQGALRHSVADLSVAITGVAGPEPDEDGNEVGRVCLAVARRGRPPLSWEKHYGATGREAICERAAMDALEELARAMEPAEAV